jgi:thiamine-phosphate pyrophosphorylase
MTERARLVLVTPRAARGEDSPSPAAWADRLHGALSSAFEGGAVDAVVINLPAADERTLVKLVKPLVALGQERNAAMLLADAPGIVARAGADGVHVSRPEDLEAALEMLRPHERIVGCGGVRARHDAMEAAERGCDYVMFGEPDEAGVAPPPAAVLERTGWWAELFETPCIGFCGSLDEVGEMAATGCEFVALGAAAFDGSASPAEAVRRAWQAIEAAPVPLR